MIKAEVVLLVAGTPSRHELTFADANALRGGADDLFTDPKASSLLTVEDSDGRTLIFAKTAFVSFSAWPA